MNLSNNYKHDVLSYGLELEYKEAERYGKCIHEQLSFGLCTLHSWGKIRSMCSTEEEAEIVFIDYEAWFQFQKPIKDGIHHEFAIHKDYNVGAERTYWWKWGSKERLRFIKHLLKQLKE